jgi:hypothetical protein
MFAGAPDLLRCRDLAQSPNHFNALLTASAKFRLTKP